MDGKKIETFHEKAAYVPDARKVAGILRVKNEAKTLEACVKSVINYVDELCIIDNDSTDGSVEIEKKLKTLYPEKVRLFNWVGNVFEKGPKDIVNFYNYSFNEYPKSEICVKIDGDQIYTKNLLNIIIKFRKESYVNPKTVLFFTGPCVHKDENGNWKVIKPYQKNINGVTRYFAIFDPGHYIVLKGAHEYKYSEYIHYYNDKLPFIETLDNDRDKVKTHQCCYYHLSYYKPFFKDEKYELIPFNDPEITKHFYIGGIIGDNLKVLDLLEGEF